MPVTLNLLPPEHVTSGALGKILKTARALNVVLLVTFLIFALGLGAYFIFTTSQLRSISASENQLKAQITTLETSEQQIVLLKDRLSKVKTVQGLSTSSKNLAKIDPFVTSLGGETNLSELAIDPQKVDLSILFKSNASLSAFLKSMLGTKDFSSVSLTTFGYNPANGYLVTFHIL